MLLLLVFLGAAETTDPLSDLGRSSSFSLYFSDRHRSFVSDVTSSPINRKYCWEAGFLSDGGKCHLCERHGEIWRQMFPQRPCSNSSIPRGISAGLNSPIPGI